MCWVFLGGPDPLHWAFDYPLEMILIETAPTETASLRRNSIRLLRLLPCFERSLNTCPVEAVRLI